MAQGDPVVAGRQAVEFERRLADGDAVEQHPGRRRPGDHRERGRRRRRCRLPGASRAPRPPCRAAARAPPGSRPRTRRRPVPPRRRAPGGPVLSSRRTKTVAEAAISTAAAAASATFEASRRLARAARRHRPPGGRARAGVVAGVLGFGVRGRRGAVEHVDERPDGFRAALGIQGQPGVDGGQQLPGVALALGRARRGHQRVAFRAGRRLGRRDPRYAPVQDGRQRVHVGACAAEPRPRRVVFDRRVPGRAHVPELVASGHGEPEQRRRTVLADHDAAETQVPVVDAGAMHALQSLGDRPQVGEELVRRQRLARLEQRRQRGARDVVHGDARRAVGLEHLPDAHHAGVVHGRHQLGALDEPGQARGEAGVRRRRLRPNAHPVAANRQTARQVLAHRGGPPGIRPVAQVDVSEGARREHPPDLVRP